MPHTGIVGAGRRARYKQPVTLSVYVHFPYCLQKCPYCDFASASIERRAVPSEVYADAVLRELEARAPALAGHTLSSIFFGGGTPSLWEPAQLGRVLCAIRSAFPVTSALAEGPLEGPLEVTVECNPSSLDRARAAALREQGVNRLSIGVQSLDDRHLRFLGRLHDGAGALRAVAEAQLEMPRVSVDLMFGMPGQTANDVIPELDRVLERGLFHLSIYALTIEPDTQFGALHRKGRLQLAKEGDFAQTFTCVSQHLRARGWSHYEVSNYALAGQTSRHNQHYWRAGAYLGLGAGAVGCVDVATQDTRQRRRYRNTPKPDAYLAATDPETREVFAESLSPEDQVREALMLGLRTSEGVDLTAVRTRTGVDPVATRSHALQRQLALGNVEHAAQRLRVPQDRWLYLDGIVADLF